MELVGEGREEAAATSVSVGVGVGVGIGAVVVVVVVVAVVDDGGIADSVADSGSLPYGW